MPIRLTELAHDLVRDHIAPGDLVVDATAGNGYDTVFLAQQVGPTGHVIAFDVQAEAIASTSKRLEAAGLRNQVKLLEETHEHISTVVGERRAAAVMFNLGYLPGAMNRDVITRPSSTCTALREALSVLRPSGIVTVLCYTGHDGGKDETAAVRLLALSLDPKRFHVVEHKRENAEHAAPVLISIQRP